MEQNRLKVNPIESVPVKGRGMNKIIIVTRKTRLTELVIKYNTLEQAKFYIEHLGADFSDYVLEDENYRKAVEIVYGKLGKKDTFRIVSKMAVNGVLFSDSMESDAIESMREAMHGKQSGFLLP